jgi:2-keto-4-pentenoate hydratase/2-oxohepta-3-ene-1,7-dioic acid hydratase in catechol pathway
MRLVRFLAGPEAEVGVLTSDGSKVVPLARRGDGWPGSDMSRLVAGWSRELRDRLAEAAVSGDGLDLGAVRLLAPLAPLRRNVFCVGKNYAEHVAEIERSGFVSSNQGPPPKPAIFTKATTAVIGPGDPIPAHADLTRALDYEGELAVVIGEGGSRIPAQAAMDHVFGYTILNDVTARDLQRDHQQWFIGKSLDGFCPMGPVITTRDEVDGSRLDVRCWVNGELRQDSNTSQLITGIPALIATISAGITLLPGDVIATGTPQGVGAGFDPPRFLGPGDEVAIEIGGLGRLVNRVTD